MDLVVMIVMALACLAVPKVVVAMFDRAAMGEGRQYSTRHIASHPFNK